MNEQTAPDPALFWVWVGRATRSKVGWILTGLGALAIIAGYLGLSRRVLVTEQLPYLISGGIGGMAMIVVGGVLLATEDVRRDQIRVEAIEADVAALRELVEELHGALLQRIDEPVVEHNGDTPARAARRARASGDHFTTPGGTTFHRPACVMLDGKSGVVAVTPATARRRGLEPCPLCAAELVPS